MLIWLDNAPTYGFDSDKEVIQFISEVITCQKPSDSPELLDTFTLAKRSPRQNVDLIVRNHLSRVH